MIRSMSYRWYFKIPTPMATGSITSSSPSPSSTTCTAAEVVEPESASTTAKPISPSPATQAPLISHLSCWRRSSPASRQARRHEVTCRLNTISQTSGYVPRPSQ
jgi:hypothetical protein